MKNIFLFIALFIGMATATANEVTENNGGEDGNTFFLFNANLSEEKVINNRLGFQKVEDVTVDVINNTINRRVALMNLKYANQFSYKFRKGNHYTLLFKKTGYFTKRIEAKVGVEDCVLCFESIGNFKPGAIKNTTGKSGIVNADVVLRKIVIDEPLKLDNIYFGFGKWDIDEATQKELDKFAYFLMDNPEVVVNIGIHSDTRGDYGDNLRLSIQRANAIQSYLVKIGIDADRFFVEGFGEKEPVNNCGERSNTNCTEEEHQQNRRIVFSVSKIKKGNMRRVGRMENQDFRILNTSIVYSSDVYQFNTFANHLSQQTSKSSVAATITRKAVPGKPALEKAKEQKEEEMLAFAKRKEKVSAEDLMSVETTTEKELPADLAKQPIAKKGGSAKKKVVAKRNKKIDMKDNVSRKAEPKIVKEVRDDALVAEKGAAKVEQKAVATTTTKRRHTMVISKRNKAEKKAKKAEIADKELLAKAAEKEEKNQEIAAKKATIAKAKATKKEAVAAKEVAAKKVVTKATKTKKEEQVNKVTAKKATIAKAKATKKATVAAEKEVAAKKVVAKVAKAEKKEQTIYKIPVENTDRMSKNYKEEAITATTVEEEKQPAMPAFDIAESKEAMDKSPIPAPLYKNTRAQLVKSDFTGYKLEIVFSEAELDREHEIFKSMKGIYHHKIEGGYSYMIGEFKTKAGIEKFYETTMYAQFPDAKIIRYKKGKRMKK